jgi:Ca2+-binding RTX toxin-like protein
MRAQVARRNFHLDGRGIKIGVISDSFNQLRSADADVASGDLPGRNNPFGYTKPVRVLQDWRPGSDEGRAMLQIIADIAPGAELLFHTAYSPRSGVTERSFSKAVKALAQAGADIIVDDVGFSTTFFQDGLTARTVADVVDQGVAYFSAIGNDSSRSYEGKFQPSTTFVFGGTTYEAHDFDPGTEVDLFQDVSLTAGSTIVPLLSWDQPVGQISSDMELFLVPTTQLPTTDADTLAVSTTLFSEGVEQPLEQLSYEASASQTAYLVIARRVDVAAPTTQVKWISTANSADSNVIYQYVNDTGQSSGASTIYGQPNARGAIAVGAVQVRKTPLFGIKPPVLDEFSSRGGTPILFDAAGNRLSTPEIRQRPQIVGPNGVETTFGSFSGFNPFFGTSAAAPHVAAVAALLLQRAGGPNRLSPAQLVEVMQRTAIPIDAAGNFRSGAGLVQADTAVLESYGNRIEGNPNKNRLRGSKVADNILGFGGSDQLRGNKGFDALFGGSRHDKLSGGDGNDYLLGEAGQDQLVGDRGHDVLLGHQGRDRLIGGEGDDLLAGGTGSNVLIGNEGRNTFVLSRDGVAHVRDFQAGRDQLGLSDGLRFEQLAFSQRREDLLIQAQGQVLARLTGIAAVAAADFVAMAIRT